ncbi:hypothetical protein QU481_19065 [Crenobacter sp. SG2303]|uniref:Uncharacterized protein n=1 Tax=Crenobacter oryzisoli TaxID=3056844 RepID=A0ABT7XT24_9NEIS|nr:hypothetical protein [Crenobacter sp. SG2303]MDN0076949.1 hypothetical protein [Crenobacter sp. SG2303]
MQLGRKQVGLGLGLGLGLATIAIVVALIGSTASGGAQLKQLKHQALSSLSLFSLAQEIDETIVHAVGGKHHGKTSVR